MTTLRVQDYDIPAGDALQINIGARFFMLLSAPENVNVYFLANNSEFGSAKNVDAPFGMGPMGKGFDQIKIETVSGAAATVKIGITDDPVLYNRISGSVALSKSSTLGEYADFPIGNTGAAAKMISADTTRRRLVIEADAGNTGTYRIGSATVAAGRGVPLGPGQSMEITSTADVYIYDSGTAGDKLHFYAEFD